MISDFILNIMPAIGVLLLCFIVNIKLARFFQELTFTERMILARIDVSYLKLLERLSLNEKRILQSNTDLDRKINKLTDDYQRFHIRTMVGRSDRDIKR